MDRHSPLTTVDIDDVCFDFPSSYAAWLSAQDRPSFDPAEPHHYRFTEVLDVSWDTYHADATETLVASLDREPLPGCGETLATVVDAGVRVWLVTARSSAQHEATAAWAARWLPPIAGLTCTGAIDGPHSTPKVDVCTRLGALAHIDDNPAHLRPLVGTATTPVGFGHYHWSEPGAWLHAPAWDDVPGALMQAHPILATRLSP